MRSLQRNEMWEFVDCLIRKKPIRCRWKNVFLHKELFEEVYMKLQEGCVISNTQSNKVCKLKKSLYGLKQLPQAWFGIFTKSIFIFGY
uniref:Retrovirus-related Pol polyprotein from transposon TNT 1-94 n=1 Tax=Cajanus cajan TaxID=3821 RepID=A0A151SUC5_CAJCA|nr:Retrovirus-related Pol polyprotein from transposon TNT 1-94 [Cajanus cajan]